MAHILVIDDDALVLESIQIVLEFENHRVDTATDGKEGLKSIRQNTYDLVITDLIMPEQDGIEVITAIKSNFPALKVLAISGGGRNSADTYLDTADLLGANGVLAKPFSATALSEKVNEILSLG